MAENLSVPAEFEVPKVKGVNMNLLPPSAFEVKAAKGDPWKEIAKATEEVAKLKLENTKLKEAKDQVKEASVPVHQPPPPQNLMPHMPQVMPQMAPVEMCKYSSNKEDFKYMTDVISKQACEIRELTDEIKSIKCHQREELADLERQLTRNEREYTHTVTSLEVQLKTAEDRYENQVERLIQEHQHECDEIQAMLLKVQEEMDLVRQRSKERIDMLENQYERLKQASEEKIENLLQDIVSKNVILENQSKQLSQLKKYVSESENVPKPKELARRENETLAAKVKTYETEKENLSSTVQLLNIRLNSLNEILRLQEQEMSKSKMEIEKSKIEELLLTRWREKVFALMVQQKSTAITSKKDEHNWKAKVCDLEQRLNSAKNQIEQLTFSLSGREAQLNMESNTCTKLQGELCEAQQLALCLDDRIQQNVHCAQTLQQFTASVLSKYEENVETVNTALSSLKGFGQRISFASGRMEMLQGLFARKEAMLKMEIEQSNIPVKDVPVIDKANPEIDGEDSSYLRHELEKVTRERDNLSAQIKQDSQTWDAKVASIRVEVADEVETLTEAKSCLESIVKDKAQELCEKTEELQGCQSDLEYAHDNIEQLKANLAKQETNMQTLLDEHMREIENESANKQADLDRQLNDSKREHAKTVVSLRQLERQSGRDKDRLAGQLNTMEEHHKRQIILMEDKLKSLEKERNLMMATLRQEGLVGKLRSERLEPIIPDWQEEHSSPADCTTGNHTTPSIACQSHTTTSIPQSSHRLASGEGAGIEHENLSTVLEDLKSLTDAVLKDDTGSSSETDV